MLGPRVLAVGLHEEAALVAVHGGGEQDEAVEACGEALHEARAALRGRSPDPGRRIGGRTCQGPRPCPPPPRVTRPCRPTSPPASTSSRGPRRTSRSTSSTTSTRWPSTPRRSSRAARARPRPPSCASRRRSASRASRSSRRPRARSTATCTARPIPTNGTETATPLFSLDQSPFESADRRRPRQRRGDGAQGLALPGRGRHRGDRDAREGADRRHRPDGVLRLLPAPPADAARHPRRDRGLAVPGGALAPRADRRRARS